METENEGDNTMSEYATGYEWGVENSEGIYSGLSEFAAREVAEGNDDQRLLRRKVSISPSSVVTYGKWETLK